MFDTAHLHPMIVHFPIALLIIGFLFDVLSLFVKKDFFSNAGFYLLILGTVGVIAAYFSGDYAGDGITETGTLKQALEIHEEAAKLTLWIVITAAVFRIFLVSLKKYHKIYKGIFLILFLFGVLSIFRTGFYGGQLVYKHAAGVQLNLGFDAQSNGNTEYENNAIEKDDD
ncbi:DUF2231 domain-containing protein [Melioribacteraceae bacterium 4301-Me]|uniref:DUF2231 domain-containing protein n=1 Tax=Pyranulibacter aquaticus TaxID=3163344 RepID=UPI0035995D57